MSGNDSLKKAEELVKGGVDAASKTLETHAPALNDGLNKGVGYIQSNMPVKVSDGVVKGGLIVGGGYVGYKVVTSALSSAAKVGTVAALAIGGAALLANQRKP